MRSIAETMELDKARWHDAWLDTPLSRPPARTPGEAMLQPGCCVKSREMQDGWPRHFGVLVLLNLDLSVDRAVVRGHGTPASPRFVWEGTIAEYLAVWDCD